MVTIQKFFKLISGAENIPPISIVYNRELNTTDTVFFTKEKKMMVNVACEGKLFDGDTDIISISAPQIFINLFAKLSENFAYKVEFDAHSRPVFLHVKDGRVKHTLVLADDMAIPERKSLPKNVPSASFKFDSEAMVLFQRNRSMFDESRHLSIVGHSGKLSFVFGDTKIKSTNLTTIDMGSYQGSDFRHSFLSSKEVGTLLTTMRICDDVTFEVYEKYATLGGLITSDGTPMAVKYLMSYRKQI